MGATYWEQAHTSLSPKHSVWMIHSISTGTLLLFSRAVWLLVTPWTAAHQASLSFTISQSLLKLMSIKLLMPSNHLILHCPFLLCFQSFPASGSFPMSQLFASSIQSIGVSASASILPVNIQGWLPLGPSKMDGSWWRVLTKCGPLEKGMENHFNIPALRTLWTVWKGKKIWQAHWLVYIISCHSTEEGLEV